MWQLKDKRVLPLPEPQGPGVGLMNDKVTLLSHQHATHAKLEVLLIHSRLLPVPSS